MRRGFICRAGPAVLAGALVAGSLAVTASPAVGRVREAVGPASCPPAWSSQATPNPSGSVLYAPAAVAADDVWTVGSRYDGQTDRTLAEHWDGASWAVVTTPSPGQAAYLQGASASSSGDVWAVGYWVAPTGVERTLAEHFDGVSWTVVATRDVGRFGTWLTAVDVVAPSDVWAVGYALRGPAYRPVAEHWDGTAWSVVPTPPAGVGDTALRGLTAVSTHDVWAVGYLVDAVGVMHPLAEHFDGTSWTIDSPPDPGSFGGDLWAVASDPGGSPWAVGSFNDGSDNLSLIERFDGAGWTRVAGDDVPASGNVLLGVSSVAGGDAWAVGYWYQTAPRGPAEPLIEHWDGVTWSRVSTPDTDAESVAEYLEGVTALPGGPAWAAGTGTEGGVLNRTCPVQVTDSGFFPGRPSVSFGDTVAWSVPSADGGPHSVTDASGLGLFDSGALPAGTSFTFTLSAAGTYRQVDSETGHAGEVGVVPAAEPSSGGEATTFRVTWSAGPAGGGFVYDVQIRRPGGGRFGAWRTGVTAPSATFIADGGAGTYSFRARLRGGGGTTGWSPPVSIVVS